MNNDLYSPEIESRFQATLKTPITLDRKWPRGCTGAGNAYLVLLGPSMGKELPGEAREVGGPNRPYRDPITIGQNVIEFGGLGRRSPRWKRLCVALLGEERYIPALTALLNLDWSHNTDEKHVCIPHLQSGFSEHIWPLLAQVKPRIICTLTRRVWDTVAPQMRQHDVTAFPRCPIAPTGPRLKLSVAPLFIRIPGCDFITMVIKPHNHPSRPYLGARQIAVINEVANWFRNQPIP